MKFEYDVKEDTRECVAYIDHCGHLVVKNTREKGSSFVFMPVQKETTYWDTFSPGDTDVKFYPGDKITITF